MEEETAGLCIYRARADLVWSAKKWNESEVVSDLTPQYRAIRDIERFKRKVPLCIQHYIHLLNVSLCYSIPFTGRR